MGYVGRALIWVSVGVAIAWPGDASAERIVYLNADPTVLTNTSGQDPTLNSYDTAGFMPGGISGWPTLDDAQRLELQYLLREATVPFDITFTWDRPAAGPYDMVVMGTAADNTALFPALGCSGAVSLADCSDTNADNVSFLFYGCMSAADQEDMHRVAFTTLTALGFGWGLENLATSGQIGGTYTFNALQFGSSCVNISSSQCADHVGCPAGQQNSTADLNARIGARVDDGPPLVTITSPTTDTLVDASFDITADVTDKFGGLTVTLDIVQAAQEMVDEEPPYEWSLSAVPAGMWTLRVVATDADGNESTDEVTVCVDVPDCSGVGGDGTGTGSGGSDTGPVAGSSDDGGPGSSDDAGAGSSTTGGSGGDGSGGGGIDPTFPADPSGFGGGPAETGCGCRNREAEGLLGWLLLFVPVLARRRRRAVTRTRDE